jgi:hypothetical protein
MRGLHERVPVPVDAGPFLPDRPGHHAAHGAKEKGDFLRQGAAEAVQDRAVPDAQDDAFTVGLDQEQAAQVIQDLILRCVEARTMPQFLGFSSNSQRSIGD